MTNDSRSQSVPRITLPRVTICRLHPTSNSGKRVAFIDVEIKIAFGPIYFFDCPVFEGEDKATGQTRLFVTPPSKPNSNPDSAQKFIPCVQWPSELNVVISEMAAKAFRDCPGGFGPKFAPTRQNAMRESGYQSSGNRSNPRGLRCEPVPTSRGEVQNRANLSPGRSSGRNSSNGYGGNR